MANNVTCGECGSLNVTTRPKTHRYQYGPDPDGVQLSCIIPMRYCNHCGFVFYDHIAEDIITENTEEYLQNGE